MAEVLARECNKQLQSNGTGMGSVCCTRDLGNYDPTFSEWHTEHYLGTLGTVVATTESKAFDHWPFYSSLQVCPNGQWTVGGTEDVQRCIVSSTITHSPAAPTITKATSSTTVDGIKEHSSTVDTKQNA